MVVRLLLEYGVGSGVQRQQRRRADIEHWTSGEKCCLLPSMISCPYANHVIVCERGFQFAGPCPVLASYMSYMS